MKRSSPSTTPLPEAKEPALTSQLAATFISQQDRFEFLQTLDRAKQLLYVKTTTPEGLAEQLRADHAEIITKAWSQFFSSPTLSEMMEVISMLEKTVQRFPTITLTLTYHPTKAQLRELALFIRKKIRETAIVSCQYDPTLVAGTVIQYNGQTIDVSLKETLSHAKL